MTSQDNEDKTPIKKFSDKESKRTSTKPIKKAEEEQAEVKKEIGDKIREYTKEQIRKIIETRSEVDYFAYRILKTEFAAFTPIYVAALEKFTPIVEKVVEAATQDLSNQLTDPNEQKTTNKSLKKILNDRFNDKINSVSWEICNNLIETIENEIRISFEAPYLPPEIGDRENFSHDRIQIEIISRTDKAVRKLGAMLTDDAIKQIIDDAIKNNAIENVNSSRVGNTSDSSSERGGFDARDWDWNGGHRVTGHNPMDDGTGRY